MKACNSWRCYIPTRRMVQNRDGGGAEGGEGCVLCVSKRLHELVARARCLVVLYCVLSGPVHRDGPQETAAAQLEEVNEVSHAAVIEWTFDGRGCDFKVLVSASVHPLVGCDS